jgi:hypothetical protein
MSRDKLRLPESLRHILDAVDRITRYSAGMDRTAFGKDEPVQDAIAPPEVLSGTGHGTCRCTYGDGHPFLESNPTTSRTAVLTPSSRPTLQALPATPQLLPQATR